jgi:N-acetylmuramic acid 6-phosphate etherase
MTSTESASPRFASMEDWSTDELVDGILEGQFSAIAAVHGARAPIGEAIDAATERLAGGGRLVYVGAGTSGRIATQDAAELPPTFNWPYERAIPVMAGGESALVRAAEGAEDSRDMAEKALRDLNLSGKDVVIALAASGRTPFAIAGLDYARSVGALAIGIYNNKGGKLGDASDIPILIETGTEFIAGSTRLKAGTAQKAALNAISTGIMIKLGFVYRGKMVEMRATNVKLKERAVLMVADLADCNTETARQALEDAGGIIKLAVVMLLKTASRPDAEDLLAKAKGNLRIALG